MQKERGDDDYEQQEILTSEYSTATLIFNGPPASSSDGLLNYNDIAKLLSQVELPPPDPFPAKTSCRFHHAESSGTKKVVDDVIEGNVEKEIELEDKHENLQESGVQFQADTTRATAKQRYRIRVHEKIRALKDVIPRCNKKDQASILDDAIENIRSLHMQMQAINEMMQFMGAGTTQHMSAGSHQSLQVPYVDPSFFMMRPMDVMAYNMAHYGSYFSPVSPLLPPFGNCFHPLVPPMQMGTGSSRLLPIMPHLQYPSQASQHGYSTALSSDTNVHVANGSQVGSGIKSSQSPYHLLPVTRRKER